MGISDFLLVVLAAIPAHALPEGGPQRIDLRPSAPLQLIGRSLPKRQRLAPLEAEDFRTFSTPDPLSGEMLSPAPTAATSTAMRMRSSISRAPELAIEPLAAHRAFDTMRQQPVGAGWRITPSHNDLGVGLTGGWGIELGNDAMAMPFVSLDYDRVDSARFVNAASPRPYVIDNADTGLTLTAGTQLAWRFGASKKLRIGAYAALVATTGTGMPGRDAASAGARVVQSLTQSEVQPIHADVGASLSYAIAPRMRLSGAVVQTVDRAAGDQLGLRVAFRMRY